MRRILRKIKHRFVKWLLSDIGEIRLSEVHVGPTSMKINPVSIIFHNNTSDPSPLSNGQMWYRSDLREFRWYDGGAVRRIQIREILVGPLSSRPSAGVAYRLYITTDTDGEMIYLDNGSSWIPLGAAFK